MRRTLFVASLAVLSACGEDVFDGPVEVDPLYFAQQRFDCDPSTPIPSCPPFTCRVDEAGNVYECDQGCAIGNDSTAFEGPEGVDICAPPVCTVDAENRAPECEPGCSDDDTTVYFFRYSC